MGMLLSLMGQGTMYSQMTRFASNTIYDHFVAKNIENFGEFHMTVLDIVNNFNSALPGKHFDAPSRKDVEEAYRKWEAEKDTEKKKRDFMTFIKENVKPSKIDHATMITGVITPPAAMAAKRAGESVPQLKMIKAVPDVVFVPTATVLGLFTVKICRGVLTGKVAS